MRKQGMVKNKKQIKLKQKTIKDLNSIEKYLKGSYGKQIQKNINNLFWSSRTFFIQENQNLLHFSISFSITFVYIIRTKMILFIFLVSLIKAQVNFTSYTNFPRFLEPLISMREANLADNGNEVLFSIVEGGKIKIIKLNARDPSNVYRMGEYTWSSNQSLVTFFQRIHIYRDILIACSVYYQTCKVFNLTTFAAIGQFNRNLFLSSSQVIESKGIYIFGSSGGSVLYVNLSAFPYPIYNFIHNQSSSDVKLKVSFDQVYLAVTYSSVPKIRIFDTSDLLIVTTINLISSNWQIIWSFDNRYLIAIPFDVNYLIVYDRNSNWAIVQNITIEYTRVISCIPYEETNSYLCIGGVNLVMFSINLYDYSVQFVRDGFQATKMRASQNNRVFLLFFNHDVPTLYYRFNKYCNGNTFYHISQKACVVCDTNCLQCLSTTQCKQCLINYMLINGTCQQCNPNQIYNQTSKLCNNIANLCSGDQYFSIPLLTCVQCKQNCARCSSTSSCEYCSENYTLVNGSCELCGLNELYNSSTRLCDDVGTFCSENQYFSIPLLTCVQCKQNCARCSSTSSCEYCSENYTLVNGSCELCGFNELYNSSTRLCDDVGTFCSENQYLSIPLIQCISCQPYCQRCKSFNNCSLCIKDYLQINGSCFPLNSMKEESLTIQLLQSPTLRLINKIPGNRIIFPQVFSFFINIDRLWLYIYHKREYGQFITDLFIRIKKLETEKWESFIDVFFTQEAKQSLDDFITKYDFKLSQASEKFLEIENQSNSFFISNFYFFCFNIPLVLMIFLMFRFLFYFIFNYKVSLLFRQYSFKLFLVCLLMEGNVESFSYFFLFDSKHLNSRNYLQKGANFFVLIFFFLFFELLVSWFWIIKIVQKDKTKYFLENFYTNIMSLFHATLTSGIFNFFLGGCHIFMEDNYKSQLVALASLEVAYMIVQIRSIRMRKVYHNKYVGWQNILASFSRVFLIFTFNLDNQIDYSRENIYSKIQFFIVSFYIANWILSMSIGYFILAFQLIKVIVINLSMCRIKMVLSQHNIGIHSGSLNNEEKRVSVKNKRHQMFEKGSRKDVITQNLIDKAQIINCETYLIKEKGDDQNVGNDLSSIIKISQFTRGGINKNALQNSINSQVFKAPIKMQNKKIKIKRKYRIKNHDNPNETNESELNEYKVHQRYHQKLQGATNQKIFDLQNNDQHSLIKAYQKNQRLFEQQKINKQQSIKEREIFRKIVE